MLLLLWLGVAACAESLQFSLPAQSAARSLLAFSQQTGIEVLFPFDDLDRVNASQVDGRMEPADAISRLLHGTGYSARRNVAGKFVVAADRPHPGLVKGRLLAPDGTPLRGLSVVLSGRLQNATTDQRGEFSLANIPPGSVALSVTGPGFRPLQITGINVAAGQMTELEPQTMLPSDELTRLEPYTVSGKSANQRPFEHSQMLETPLRAAGNLDLPRSENGALPYSIYDRDQLTRSGVVDLNDFLQRELLEGDAATRPPGSATTAAEIISGSTNLNLRGYGADETVILVNGRRLPEMLTTGSGYHPPDVNLIPLSLVQQVEVLPVSASSLYTGNAVGGVINIVLRPEADTNSTEVSTTYTNALHGYDAPQSALSLLHSQALLTGRLRVRLSLNTSRSVPPTESELRYRQSRPQAPFGLGDPVYRATPNIRSSDGSPLFGLGTSPVTSVAPGADGSGGLAAFNGRAGLRNFGWYDSPSSLSISSDSLDYPYGLRQQRIALAGSVVYDMLPWLQLGLDGVGSRMVINRGADVFRGDLLLKAANPLNPFGRDVQVTLNETAPLLGDKYSEARVSYSSLVFGAQLKPVSDWRVALDGQFAHNVVQYRGLSGVDSGRWQSLVDQGAYNPLRDTQLFGPPQAFYDKALLYLGGKTRFVTLGDYETLDGALRATNQNLSLPTGPGVVNFGADYRMNHLANFTENVTYADGTPARDPYRWTGRTLERYSVFGELQAPLLPARWLPHWLHSFEGDASLRYVAAASSKERNLAPTLGLKLETNWGLSFRTSLTTSSRVPTPQMSLPQAGGVGPSAVYENIYDPRRNQTYAAQINEQTASGLLSEDSLTQTAGLVLLYGKTHRLRAALDFVDTRKTNEVLVLTAQDIVDLEAQFPNRIVRALLSPGDTHATGLVTRLLTGPVNTDWRHSQNWSGALDYAWTECLGGTFEIRSRVLWYQRYERRVFAFSPVVDELGQPDTLTSSVLKYRANLSAGWSTPRGGFGFEAHYFHSRILPEAEWISQGHNRIRPYWQCDGYLQGDVGRWLPWRHDRYGLRAQLRVNNLLATPYPKYANEGSGSGVQPYGDWRSRTCSLSLTATF